MSDLSIRHAASALAILLLMGLTVLFWPRPQSPPSLAAQAYPLYGAATWKTPTRQTLRLATTTYAGVGVASRPLATGSDVASLYQAFLDYYEGKLLAAGWTPEYALSAAQPGVGQDVYRRGAQVFIARYAIDFTGASSTCPCAATFSLFSGSR